MYSVCICVYMHVYYVAIQLEASRKQWMIGTDGERESEESVLSAGFEDKTQVNQENIEV